MKNIYAKRLISLTASTILLLLFTSGCNNNNNEDLSKGEINQESIKVNYNPNTIDELISKNIANYLVQDYLKSDLEFLNDNDRKFQFYKIDLNGDGKDEYFVRLIGSYFCGSGGCTILLIDYYSELITKFTVMEMPIYISEDRENGWLNLYVFSNGSDRVLKYDGKSYPSNPSVAEEFDLDKNKVVNELFNDDNSPAFTYIF